MSNNNDALIITLESRIDVNNEVYYIGKILAPILLDAKQGIAFLVFLSDKGNETLQISSITVPNDKYRKEIK
jgi:hypothetical protein